MITIIYFVFTISACVCVGDWYWRDYNINSDIPDDAIIVGMDSVGPVYIGQGFCNLGLFTGRLFPKQTLEVWCYQNVSTLGIPKIFCAGDENKFRWLKVGSGTFKDDVGNNTLISAGFHLANSLTQNIHIARCVVEEVDRIGFALTYLSQPYMDYARDGWGYACDEYEVLIYDY